VPGSSGADEQDRLTDAREQALTRRETVIDQWEIDMEVRQIRPDGQDSGGRRER